MNLSSPIWPENNVISLPTTFVYPKEWFLTPQQMMPVTQSYLANYTDIYLRNLSGTLLAGKIISLAGSGISLYFMSIPGILLSGAGLIICLIGRAAIRREQITRCQRDCLEFEQWLLKFKNTWKNFRELALPFFTDKIETISSDQKEKLINAFNSSDNEQLLEALTTHATKLLEHHENLFGKMRQIKGTSRSNSWITLDIQAIFVEQMRYFKAWLLGFKNIQNLKDLTEDLSDQLLYSSMQRAKLCLEDQLYHERLFNKLSIINKAEVTRKSIAAFRSSLLSL